VKIVVGLGNPGNTYAETRHNAGWMVLDRIADRAGWGGRAKARDGAAVTRGRYGDLDLALVKPTTYMNMSGLAVRKVLAREHSPLTDLLVVVDDFALPLGRLRMREEGSAGGHNGLRSIIAEMGTQKFARLRVGIGEPTRDGRDHVLSRFTSDERTILDLALDAAADAVEDWAREGPTRAANRWNAWRLPETAIEEPLESPRGAQAAGAGRSPASRGASPAGDAKTASPDALAATTAAAPPAPSAAPPAQVGTETEDRPVLGADGITRTRTGWRRVLPSLGARVEPDANARGRGSRR
jgi:PTH1 family peptidyl-tRNA hydrolase